MATWVGSVHCSLSLSPGSKNILCFPIYQETAPEREMKDRCFSHDFYQAPGLGVSSELWNASKRAKLCWDTQRKSHHQTSQKVFLNHILNAEREGLAPSNLPLWNISLLAWNRTPPPVKLPQGHARKTRKPWLTYIMDIWCQVEWCGFWRKEWDQGGRSRWWMGCLWLSSRHLRRSPPRGKPLLLCWHSLSFPLPRPPSPQSLQVGWAWPHCYFLLWARDWGLAEHSDRPQLPPPQALV